MYRGAFLNLLTYDPGAWERQLSDLDGLGGLDHLELWLEFIPSRRELAALADLLGGRRTIMHGPFIGMSIASSWSQLADISVDRCLRAVEVAAYLGCEVVTVHTGIVQRDEPQEAVLDRIVARFERLSGFRQPAIAIENMAARRGATRESVASTEHLADLLERLPSLQVTLDTGHALQAGDDPVAFAAVYCDRIANIHLHDGHRGGKGHLRLDTAELDLPGLLHVLEHGGYGRFLTLETVSVDDTAASWEVLNALVSSAVAQEA